MHSPFDCGVVLVDALLEDVAREQSRRVGDAVLVYVEAWSLVQGASNHALHLLLYHVAEGA